MKTVIKGFIFDLDGVLTDTAEYHYQAWKALAEDIDIEIDREFNEQLKGISRLESLERILIYGNKQDQFSEAEKNQLAEKKNEHYKELIQEITPNDLLEGIPDFLTELESSGIKLSLASASKNAPFILKKLGIADKFLEVVNPADLNKGKPDPEIFMKGAEQLNLTTQECIGVEDAEAGIQSINDADMFSVGVGSAESMKDADYYVEKTSELNLNKILSNWETSQLR